MTTYRCDSWSRGRAARRLRRYGLPVLFFIVIVIPAAASAQDSPDTPTPLRAGDIVASRGPTTPPFPPFDHFVVLLKADPSTGVWTTLSNFADPSQGPISVNNASPMLAVEGTTAIFVVHSGFGTDGRGALLHVDPLTGLRTIISDFGDASQGPPGGLSDLAIEPSGDFLLISLNGMLRVNRSTGMRAIISDFTDPGQGPVFGVSQVAVEESGQIVVLGSRGLLRIDPSNGLRTLLSDFADPTQGFRPINYAGLAVDSSGYILFVDFDRTPRPPPPMEPSRARLIRVDPRTGVRTRVTDSYCSGGDVQYYKELAIQETGDILVASGGFAVPADVFLDHLSRMDSTTGTCAYFDFPLGQIGQIGGLAVVPTPLVNGAVSLSVTSTVLEPPMDAMDDPLAPAGLFRITATFTNETAGPIRNPFFRVAELSGGNMLVSGDRPPDLIRAGGKGTRQTPNVGTDGVLSPGESVAVEFAIGLQTRQAFTFFVNVFGEPDVSEAKTASNAP